MIDSLWLLVSALLVFLMQVGFLCLESGRTRSKNNINVAAKNIIDFIVSSSIFWLIGFGLMFGASSNGWVGQNRFVFGDGVSSFDLSFFVFQMMFCGTAATLMSGAIAERVKFGAYIVLTIILSALIYPIAGHWAWAGLLEGNTNGWLQELGFIDFAGSTVVHSVGGWVSFSALIVIGPRLGRFSETFRFPTGSDLPMASMGVLLIWFGWFGFNGGSTLAFSDDVPSIVLNTCLAAIWGGLVVAFIHYVKHRFIDVAMVLNGLIAGLVGITAGCYAVSAADSALIGVISGVVVYVGTWLLDKLRIDDALGVIPAHLLAGIWGTLAVALFGDSVILATGLSMMEQLAVQALGVVTIGLYSFAVSFVLIFLLNKRFPLRVSKEDEIVGLNVTEHRASTELIDLLSEMEDHQQHGKFTSEVKEEPFTEVGQIAKKYNQVISRVTGEINRREAAILDFKVSEGRKSAILNSSADCIISIDHKGRIIEFNTAAERTFGCLRQRVLNLSFVDSFIPEKDQNMFNESLENRFINPQGILLNKKVNMELKRASGQNFPSELAISLAMLDNYFEEYTLQIRDVTQELKLRSKLNFLAYQDPLTGLSNRTYLLKELRFKILRGKEKKHDVVVFFLDLDKFKHINDTLGHKAGDTLLCDAADRLRRVCRDDDVIARIGGDEFIVAIDGKLSDSVIKKRAEKILEAMRAPIDLGGKQYRTPASVGISRSHNGDTDVDEMIQQADIAMYHAKVNGRDHYVIYDEEIGEKASRNASFERLIKVALEQRQFRLCFQPKVDRSGNISSMESLIRWTHPEMGTISPAEFIPIAEDSHLIISIGEYVLEQVMKTLCHMRECGLNLVPVAVNISGRHLLSNELATFVEKSLFTFGIEGKYLEIEITESSLITNIDYCVSELAKLKALGVSVSIDDFGTGYSALSYLKRLPLDKLKIDRSFVKECHNQTQDLEICATIVNLARSLKLEVVAEGVELEEQVEVLSSLGCDVFQGFLFYKPLEIADIHELFSTHFSKENVGA